MTQITKDKITALYITATRVQFSEAMLEFLCSGDLCYKDYSMIKAHYRQLKCGFGWNDDVISIYDVYDAIRFGTNAQRDEVMHVFRDRKVLSHNVNFNHPFNATLVHALSFEESRFPLLKEFIAYAADFKQDIDFNIGDTAGTNAVMYAAHYNSLEAFTYLLTQALNARGGCRINLNAQTIDGKTILHFAVDWYSADEYDNKIALLLKHGADPRILNERGQTPRDVAQKSGKDVTAGLLEFDTSLNDA